MGQGVTLAMKKEGILHELKRNRTLFLMILPSNNTKLVDFGEYVDCIIDGTKEIIDFQNFGQMIQASRQVFI